MIPLWLALAGAGAAKSELIDKPQEKRDRKLAAEVTRWSPWTGMQAQVPKHTDTFGSALQGGMTGAAMGQNMDMQQAYLDYLRAMQGGQATAPQEGDYNFRGPPRPAGL